MRTRLTLAQYIQNPLTAKEIAYFKKLEGIPNIVAAIMGLAFFITGWIVDMPDPSLNFVLAVFGGGATALLTVFVLHTSMEKNDFRISDNVCLNSGGIFNNRELYPDHQNLKIDDVQTLIENVKSLNRSFIKLDRDIIHDLFCEQINLQTKALLAKEGELA